MGARVLQRQTVDGGHLESTYQVAYWWLSGPITGSAGRLPDR